MRVVWTGLLVIASSACGNKDAAAPQIAPPTAPLPQQPAQADDTTEPDKVTQPDFPEGTRSLELVRTVGVRLEPGDDAKRIGTVAVDTRVGWERTAPGKGCQKNWILIRPRGWICGDYVKPSKHAPFGREVPALDRGELVPGVYGKVTAPNSVTYVVEKPDQKKDRDKDKRKKDKPGPITSPKDIVDAVIKPEVKLV